MNLKEGNICILRNRASNKKPFVLVKIIKLIPHTKLAEVELLDVENFTSTKPIDDLNLATFGNLLEVLDDLIGWADWNIFDIENTPLFSGDLSVITKVMCDEWFNYGVLELDIERNIIKLDVNVCG